MTVIINLIGSPGSGKSTLSALLFGEMKKRGYSVDLVTEYAKELVWEDRQATFDDELYIFAKQNHRLFRVNGKVDYVITDAPILQKLYYMPKEFDFSDLVIDVYNQYTNINYFLERKWWDFENNGRNQTEEESDKIKSIMVENLNKHNINYTIIPKETSTDDDIKLILEYIDYIEKNNVVIENFKSNSKNFQSVESIIEEEINLLNKAIIEINRNLENAIANKKIEDIINISNLKFIKETLLDNYKVLLRELSSLSNISTNKIINLIEKLMKESIMMRDLNSDDMQISYSSNEKNNNFGFLDDNEFKIHKRYNYEKYNQRIEILNILLNEIKELK